MSWVWVSACLADGAGVERKQRREHGWWIYVHIDDGFFDDVFFIDVVFFFVFIEHDR